ncbi:MAG: hypothetical protein LBS70_08345, partial [Candidatus Accumulibacter sp.]|jgi:hypothetical protein|nr:hypothetical protein [Accumulibacter sp.]
VLDVEGASVMRRWFMVRYRDKRLTPALAAFWDFVLEFAPDYLERLAHPERINHGEHGEHGEKPRN